MDHITFGMRRYSNLGNWLHGHKMHKLSEGVGGNEFNWGLVVVKGWWVYEILGSQPSCQ